MYKFSCLTNIPEMTKGLVRELRVRWMLQELGLPYEAEVYPHSETKKDPYLKKQPFGQVPYFESDDFSMFETGAILLHLALKHNKLLSSEEQERAHALQWMFVALNSIEPYFFHHMLLKWDPDAPESMKNKAKKIVEDRLRVLSQELGTKKYFGKDFSIAEIIMTTVLNTAHWQGFLNEHQNLSDYVKRNESRPALQRALAEHVKLYEN